MNTTARHRTRALLGATPILAAALLLAACTPTTSGGATDASPSAATTSPASTAEGMMTASDQDVMFVQMMLPHHQQAIEMDDMIIAKSGIDSRVIDLANRITSEQQPEIDTMNSWLTAWGATTASGMSGMSGGSGTGMMSDSDMTELGAATGADAAKLYLEQMTAHHRSAVEMAQTEVNSGGDRDVIAFAQKIIDSQTAEITEMGDLLATMS